VKRFFIFKPYLRAAIRDGIKTQTRRVGKPKHAVGDIVVLPEPLVREFIWGCNLAAYKDDDAIVKVYKDENDLQGNAVPWRWQRSVLPSIHMPTDLGRTKLRITDVCEQRLQEISEEDAKAEGVAAVKDLPPHPIDAFETLWDAINGDRGYPWVSNPAVTAYTWEFAE
jgi:hypothetical protein